MAFLFKPVIFLVIALALFLNTKSYGQEQCGTLVVSYQTGPREERLERVRFRLESETLEQKLYPKGAALTSDNGSYRTVVIDQLPIGKYTIKFLVPNSDALFEECPLRTIELQAGEVLKISQMLKPRYASLKAVAAAGDGSFTFSQPPTITLKDQFDEIRAESTLGKLNIDHLLPGRYTLIFGSLTGYATPEPVTLQLKPSERAGPLIGYYTPVKTKIKEKGLSVFCKECLLQFSHVLFPLLDAAEKKALGILVVKSNLPHSRWILYRFDLPIYQGEGLETKLEVSAGKRYQLRIEEIEGYSSLAAVKNPFEVTANKETLIEIRYEKSFK